MHPLLKTRVSRDLRLLLKEIVVIAAALAVYVAVTGGGISYATKVFFEHLIAITGFGALVGIGALLYLRRRGRARSV